MHFVYHTSFQDLDIQCIHYSKYVIKILYFEIGCNLNFILFGFPIFWFWAYLMKVITETCVVCTKFDIYVFNTW